MCRKNHLRGCLLLGLGLGLMVGQCLDSWFLCSCGGVTVLLLGLVILRKN